MVTHTNLNKEDSIAVRTVALPLDNKKYGDLGYQGWQKESINILLPHKKPKNDQLTIQQKWKKSAQ